MGEENGVDLMDTMTVWLCILTMFFVLESVLLLYFVNWILWRWNTLLTRINKGEPLSNTDDEE